MSALWESSTRSLFVKTVWKDGHRHVLLQQEADKSPQKSASREPPKPPRSAVPNKPHLPHLRVPSVKLRLKRFRSLRIDSVKNKKVRETSTKTKRTVPRENPEEVVKKANEPEENRLKSQYNENKYRKITKAYTIDVEDASKNSILAETYPIGTKFLQQDDNFTSLSDRVLMWLDLATQNGSCSESVANFKRIPVMKPRVVTAGVFQSNKAYFNSFDKPNITCQRQYQFSFDEDDSFTSEECYSSDDSILKCNGINLDNGKGDDSEEIISEEEEKVDSSGEKTKLSCCASDKRQLHIFMPTFSQIMLEVDEISLLSKCSSIVQLNEA